MTDDIKNSNVSVLLLDLECCLGYLLGNHAHNLVRSVPVSNAEEDCQKWLREDIFSGGLEPVSYLPVFGEEQGGKEMKSNVGFGPTSEEGRKLKSMSPSDSVPALEKQSSRDSSILLAVKQFLRNLVDNDQSDATVQTFNTAVRHYCQSKMWITGSEGKPGHPVEWFGRHYMACLLKHGDLVQVAMDIENKAAVDKELEARQEMGRLPPQLCDVCKLVYDGKLRLMKEQHESAKSYDEVCGPPVQRCRFLINEIAPFRVDILPVLRKRQVLDLRPRWQRVVKKLIMWGRVKREGPHPHSSIKDSKGREYLSEDSGGHSTAPQRGKTLHGPEVCRGWQWWIT